ncbi:MAG: hypothetical protein LBL93_06985 [Ruminococcus sp.]|jgi:hypothetical protein|nr:hypothetical protein [Ruminococcus sp.]
MARKTVTIILLILVIVGLGVSATIKFTGKDKNNSSSSGDSTAAMTETELKYIKDKMFNIFVDNFEWQLQSVEKRTLADSERMASYIGKTAEMSVEQLKMSLDPNFPYNEVYYAMETDGKYIGTSDSADMSVDYRTRPWYVGAKSADGAFISDPYNTVTNESGEKIITFSYPIKDSNGKFTGAFGIDMNGEELMKRLLPKSLAPYISGIIVTDESGEVMPFFDSKNADTIKADADFSSEVTSDFHKWTVHIYGDFSKYNNTLKKMSFADAKNSYNLDAVKQMTFQLESSTSYIKFNVKRNSAIYARIKQERTTDFLKNIVKSVNTENWAYDDVYYVLDNDGKYIGLDSTVPESTDFRDRPWYVTAKSSLDVSQTEFYESISGSRQKIMTFTAPLLNENGEFVGAVGFDITTESAKSMLYNGDASLEALLILIE